MRFLKIINGKISVAEASEITLEMLQREVDGHVQKVTIHTGINNRNVVLYVNEDARLQGRYTNFLLGNQWIAGHAAIVTEKGRNGMIVGMSDHEINSIKILDSEFISLLPTHVGYQTNPRRDAE